MTPDIADIIAGELKVSRGTAYDLMREALKQTEQPAVQDERYNALLDDYRAVLDTLDEMQLAKREWVDLEEIDFVGINQSCTTKMQAAAAAARLLKEKNGGAA